MRVSHFHRELQRVKEDLVRMAGMVEESIHQAIDALSNRDAAVARDVIAGDRRIDVMENSLDRRCLNLLATQQPVAVDLRFLASALKVCSFLERMGDQAVNLAQRALAIVDLHSMPVPTTILTMGDIACEMTANSLDSFLREDVELAEKVMKRDDDLDVLNRTFLEDMIEWMNDEHRVIRRGVELILASRHLERIGDEATNIGEEAIFLVEGRIVRHGGETADSVGPL